MRPLFRLIALVIAAAAIETSSPGESLADGAQTGAVSGVVTVMKDDAAKADKSGVVVYLESVPFTPKDEKREIRQKNLTFTPGLMVIVKGTTVEFPNDDKVFHNVFSVSKAARFDLGLYKSGESKSVTFREAGVVDVYCNIHPEMAATILVVQNGWFTPAHSDGSYTLAGGCAGDQATTS